MTIWFTADTHFGHANIIKYCNRPFSSVEEMDRTMINNWNERVKPDDTVYHLGDFSFKTANRYTDRLNRNIKFLWGNHDSRSQVEHNVELLGHYYELELNGQLIVLCHYKFEVWNCSHRGALHFYGHSHGTLAGDSQCVDVGVDNFDFAPVTLEQIRKRLTTHLKRKEMF